MKKTIGFLFIFSLFFLFPKRIKAVTSTTLYLPSYEKVVETGERNTYYAVPGITIQRNLKDGVEKVYYLFPDHLGSTRVVVDNNHSTPSYLTYYPYGKTKTDTNTISSVKNRYTGQEQDKEVDLYYYNACYYNPQIGHFISADSAQGPNRYTYVANNPINANDPSGNEGNTPQYKSPLEQFWISFKRGKGLRDYVMEFDNLLVLGVFASRGGDERIYSEQSFKNKEFSKYVEKVYSDTNFSATNDFDFITSLTASINKNTVYNKKGSKLYETARSQGREVSGASFNSALGLDRVFFGTGDVGKVISENEGLCVQFAATEHFLLGRQGIQSELVASDKIFHTFLKVNIEGVPYIVDPTWNVVMEQEKHMEWLGLQLSDYVSQGSLFNYSPDDLKGMQGTLRKAYLILEKKQQIK